MFAIHSTHHKIPVSTILLVRNPISGTKGYRREQRTHFRTVFLSVYDLQVTGPYLFAANR